MSGVREWSEERGGGREKGGEKKKKEEEGRGEIGGVCYAHMTM